MPTSPSRSLVSPVVLCIAGFDPSGGAGLLADARACAAFGAFAVCAQTALVVQNGCGVRSVHATNPDVLALQIETLATDVPIRAIKMGMLPNLASLEAITPFLRSSTKVGVPLVVDPVLAPSSGAAFVDESLLEAIRAQLLPLATLVTPNVPETARLCELETLDSASAEFAARELWKRGGSRAVLLKGGHLVSGSSEVVDWFFDGSRFHELRAARVEGVEVRGTGCLLASAIAAQLARDVEVLDAARIAKKWLAARIENAQPLGSGRRVAVF